MPGHELLTTAEMAEADRLAADAGVPTLTLMESAGRAVADEAAKMVGPGARIAVLCGPGNNGGDGFVAARHLRERGFNVRLSLLGDAGQLKGDAQVMAQTWSGPVEPMSPSAVNRADLVIDALFGAGLTRPLSGQTAAVVQAVNASGIKVLAVDVPSGLDGTTGHATGPVVRADRTVTFFRQKPGHLLMPGRALCGETIVSDIGISQSVLDTIRPEAAANDVALWQSRIPWPQIEGHKYSRGHALVVSGPAFRTGAARLAARGALRIGAGLVTVASPSSALPENAAHLTAIMLMSCETPQVLASILEDTRKNAVLIGPAAGVGPETAEMVIAALRSGAAVTLDADALTAFSMAPSSALGHGFGFTAHRRQTFSGHQALFDAIADNPARPVVMTPHEGEFARLFPDVGTGSKLDRARAAAKLSGAIVLLKGPDTVIAAPDGRAAINANAPPWLATAGSGDVLAGFVTGLLAQKMPAFEAACAAVWLHGETASTVGAGLIAEDLPENLPKILDRLYRDTAGRA